MWRLVQSLNIVTAKSNIEFSKFSVANVLTLDRGIRRHASRQAFFRLRVLPAPNQSPYRASVR